MREPLAGVTVRLDGTPTPTTTTIAAVGGSVLVLATAAPALPLTLTSCYLARPDGALAVSHLRLSASEETFSQYILPAAQLHATLAGACLLEHAARPPPPRARRPAARRRRGPRGRRDHRRRRP